MRRWKNWLALLPVAVSATVQAQQFNPHLGYAHPAGGRQGTKFQVSVGGEHLDGVAEAHFTGAGIEAKILEHAKPLSPAQFAGLRDKVKDLLEQKGAALRAQAQAGKKGAPAPKTTLWTAEDAHLLEDIKAKIAGFVFKPSSPLISETVLLEVTVAQDAEPGVRDLRLRTPVGLSNPLTFRVGTLPEHTKKPIKIADPLQLERAPKLAMLLPSNAPATAVDVTLPIVVNGQIGPAGVDRYRFHARQGQHLVVSAAARELVPYIPDAVPGWFQATLTLRDAEGRELAYADDYRHRPDPVFHYQVPKDGDYIVEIKDAIYRGREDFVYRVTMGELPFVTGVFPLGGRAGAPVQAELSGWNLGTTRFDPKLAGRGLGIHTVPIPGTGQTGHRLAFALDNLPESLENEPNNQPEYAQTVTTPLIVNGRIQAPGDVDVFQFAGRAGEVVVAEVTARRLDSPLDSQLRLFDTNGQMLAFNDDFEDKGAGLTTHHADSRLRVTLPAAGIYFLHLGDTQRKGGPEYAYRLRISPPQPDFVLKAAPSSINVRAGSSTSFTVYALRKDGFNGEIFLRLKGAPPGYQLDGGRIPAGQDKVRVTLTAPGDAKGEFVTIALEGHANIQGRPVVRGTLPAEDMTQAFSYHHLVPAQEFLVATTTRFAARRPPQILDATPLSIPASGTARLRTSVPLWNLFGNVELELNDPPPGLAVQKVAPSGLGSEITLVSDPAKIARGLEGNLIFNVVLNLKLPAAVTNQIGDKPFRLTTGTLPAVPFKIAAR